MRIPLVHLIELGQNRCGICFLSLQDFALAAPKLRREGLDSLDDDFLAALPSELAQVGVIAGEQALQAVFVGLSAFRDRLADFFQAGAVFFKLRIDAVEPIRILLASDGTRVVARCQAFQKLIPLLGSSGSLLQLLGSHLQARAQNAQAAESSGKRGGIVLDGDLFEVDLQVIAIRAGNLLLRRGPFCEQQQEAARNREAGSRAGRVKPHRNRYGLLPPTVSLL